MTRTGTGTTGRETAGTALREQVRQRYAAAATAVAAGGSNTDALAAEACCGTSTATDESADDAAGDAGGGCCSTGSGAPGPVEVGEPFGAALYNGDERSGLPPEALVASLGCGNPLAVAELHPGERVLDLGSGGGIDVLLSARRAGPAGCAYGVDMTEEMLALARASAAKVGAPDEQANCCEPAAKGDCCGTEADTQAGHATGSCGCR